MNENPKGFAARVFGAGIKSLALFILVCAAIALTGLAIGIVFATGALLVLLLIFALIVNPGEVKRLFKLLDDKISALITRLEALTASMSEIISEISAAAQAASGAAPGAAEIHDQDKNQEQEKLESSTDKQNAK